MSILELGQEDMLKQKDWEDIQDLEKEKVPEKAECHRKFFGSEDKEFLGDY